MSRYARIVLVLFLSGLPAAFTAEGACVRFHECVPLDEFQRCIRSPQSKRPVWLTCLAWERLRSVHLW